MKPRHRLTLSDFHGRRPSPLCGCQAPQVWFCAYDVSYTCYRCGTRHPAESPLIEAHKRYWSNVQSASLLKHEWGVRRTERWLRRYRGWGRVRKHLMMLMGRLSAITGKLVPTKTEQHKPVESSRVLVFKRHPRVEDKALTRRQ